MPKCKPDFKKKVVFFFYFQTRIKPLFFFFNQGSLIFAMRTQLTSCNTTCADLASIDSNLLNKLIVILPQKETEEFSLEENHLLKR